MLIALLISMISAPAEPVVVFDVAGCFSSLGDDSVARYDALNFAVCLQGLVNRDRPRLALRFLPNVDDYWLDRLREDWLKDRPVKTVASLEELVALYPREARGAVVWEPSLPSTFNVAATMCGVEGWLPIRADGALYNRLVAGGPMLAVKSSLVGKFAGKCDAYAWAKKTYLDTGKCNTGLMAYFVDAYTQRPGQPGYQYPDLVNTTIPNRDYYIARKAFFFDLGVWPDEVSVDDAGQAPGADRAMLIDLLKSLNKQNKNSKIATIGGFVPWDLKYTNFRAAGGTRSPVDTEWEYAAVLSAHNTIMDADALGLGALANASIYSHYPLKKKYRQNPRPARRALEPKTYVLIYMGDYDSAAWLARHVAMMWDDPARGTVPLAWAFNPNLAQRVPHVFDHVYKTKSPNDWFIGGDSGAGYLNPNLLAGNRLGSGLPDALDMWVAHNKRWYKRFDYSITGFVINGFHGDMPLRVQNAYARFSPDGVGMQLGFEQPIVDQTPFVRHSSDIYPKLDNLQQTADEMARFSSPEKPQFIIFRVILQSPGTIAALQKLMAERHGQHSFEFCDPYTFFDLYRQSVQGTQPQGSR